jgi:E3 ubiquitin-protein ligase BAH
MCPLCREDVVMKADSTCLDEGLIRFMKLWFPGEVKAKQKGNERIALEEQFGKAMVQSGQCVVM